MYVSYKVFGHSLKMLQKLIINLFVFYSSMCVNMRIGYRVAKKKSSVFSGLCDFIETIYKILTAAFVYITSNRIEPNDAAWINVCQYLPYYEYNNTDRYLEDIVPTTVDIYSTINERHLKLWPDNLSLVLDSCYRDIFYSKYANIKQSVDLWTPAQKKNLLVYGKLCPSTVIIKTMENVDPEKDLDNVSHRVGFRFMEVEYKCGDMNEFAIDIPYSHYISGNEILSKTYILRYLEHLPIYVQWVYNKNYILKIIDEDLNVIKLNCNQYIRLKTDGYDIIDMTIPPPPPDLELYDNLVPNSEIELLPDLLPDLEIEEEEKKNE